MRLYTLRFCLLFLSMCTVSAWAQINCTLSVTNVTIAVNTTQANSDASANINVNCNRPGNQQTSNPADETYTISIGQGLANRNLTGGYTNPATLLPYQIYKDPAYIFSWTTVSPSAAFTTSFSPGNNNNFTITLPYYFRIPTPTIATAGTYGDTIVVTLNTSPGGAFKASTSLAPIATIANACKLNVNIQPLALNYPSFSTATVTGKTDFYVTCTNTTYYTMALDSYGGTLLGLNYTLNLSASSANGSGVVQSFAVNGSVAAGQAGTCAGGICSDFRAHTLTITY